jgi:hypothetical protein
MFVIDICAVIQSRYEQVLNLIELLLLLAVVVVVLYALAVSKMLEYLLFPNFIFSIIFSIASHFDRQLHYWFAWHCSIYIFLADSFLLL